MISTTFSKQQFILKKLPHEKERLWITCDPFVLAVIACPNVITSQTNVHATIELEGRVTKGMMVIDWRNMLGKKQNVNIIEKVNLDQFKALLLKSVQ